MKKIYLLLFATIISCASFAQIVDILDTYGTSGNVVIGGSNYHVSEQIYTQEEIGPAFLTAGSAIQRVNFVINTLGAPTTVTNFRLYMKNVPAATTTLATGVYSTAGYTQVYNGTFNATPAGLAGVTLTTPFVRTANTNLQILIERFDNVLHTGYNFDCAAGNTVGGVANPAALSCRRYNAAALPVSGTTSLTASNFRPAIELVHVFPVDASVVFIDVPSSSCYTTTQTVDVFILNEGTTNIAAGAASTTLHIRGANTFSGTKTNTAIILPGDFEAITFTGINMNNVGKNLDTAYVTLAGDGTTYYDTLATEHFTAPTLSTYPIVEDVETTLPVFPYAQAINLGQAWGIQVGPYSNLDQTVPLAPRAPGTRSYIFDSYNAPEGFESRLYSNCIAIPTVAELPLLTFWLSHDNIFPTTLDSIYVTVSTDKGVTWTRLAGYQRPDVTATTPLWRMESLSLAAYANQTIQIGFEGVSKFGNAFLLDDITLSKTIPVGLLSFEAQRNGRVNNLTWSTSQEQNSSRFIVERSNDGLNFAQIGVVAAAGNSSSRKDYQFTDPSPVKGINYYRLRAIDINSDYKFSMIRNVKNLGVTDLSFAPNPVQSNLKVDIDAISAGNGVITIIDISGKPVYRRNVSVVSGNNSYVVEAGKFSQGTYFIKIQLASESIVRKFNKL
ncbi:MAG: T9SS type A sorting domain-containing protein [Ferruginibacter sp.]